MKCLIGADPELFVRKGNHFISGHIFECGTKENPMKTEHGYVQVDGLSLEVNVLPSSSLSEFRHNIFSVLDDLSNIVVSSKPGCSLVPKPSVYFGSSFLSKLPSSVSMLGCSADFSAYTKGMNQAPNANLPFRTGAGHIHIGWTDGEKPRDRRHFNRCVSLAKNLDYFLGLPSLFWDKDNRRRLLYGKAGAFRPKHYGMEYRVPSNAWLAKQELIDFVYNTSVAAFEATVAGEFLFEKYGDYAKNRIDSGVLIKEDTLFSIIEETRHGRIFI